MSDSLDISSVSLAEIRAFRTSMAARRFPALREMLDQDIAILVLQDRKTNKTRPLGTAAGLKASEPPANYMNPSGDSQFRALSPKKTRPPFTPCNPSQAKDDIHRKGEEPFAGSLAAFEKCQTRESGVKDKAPFVPNSAAEAKSKIQINYYLNSPDEETLQTEKAFIAQRASLNTQSLLETHGRVKKQEEEC